jgi:CRP/FNR family transcriptional regulator, anaerobic regulatory protein
MGEPPAYLRAADTVSTYPRGSTRMPAPCRYVFARIHPGGPAAQSSGIGPTRLILRLRGVPLVTGSNGNVAVHDELMLGRRELSARFRVSPPRTLSAGELLEGAPRSSSVICHLVVGWACQFHGFSDGHQAIVDVYTPGDVIGLDAVLRTRPSGRVMTLTSVTTEVIDAAREFTDLMTCRSTALYVAWLLGRRQQRLDRLLAAISSLDARGRLATIVLDFYARLRRQRLITGSSYNLPLTQIQIGAYLGLTVAHVNRVLRSLRDERIVQLEKHCVPILDFERLSRLTLSGRVANSAAALEAALSDEPAPAGGQRARIAPNFGQPSLRPAAVGSASVT